MSGWILDIRRPAASASTFELPDGDTLAGREPGCGLELDDPRVSARHCWIRVLEAGVEIEDLRSTNGVFLDGRRVSNSAWRPGQTLALGGTELRLRRKAGSGGTSVELDPGHFDFSIVSERNITGDDAQRHRLRLLQQCLRELQAALPIADLLDRIMLLLFEAVQCDTGYILVTDPEHPERIHTHLAYAQGRRRENLDAHLYSRTLVSRVLESKSGFLFDSDAGSSGPDGGRDASLSIFQLHIKTALCCPIHSEGRVFGVIYLDSKKSVAKFNGEDLDLAMNAAGIAGMAIENSELYRKLRAEAEIREHLKRFVSPNVAEQIIATRGGGQALQSQKTHLSVLFADIRGFTPLAEALSPVTVAELLNAYFSSMSDVAFHGGGTLDKFIGDCMMVLFNAPFALPEHELAAVTTAVEMRRRLVQIRPEWKRRGLPEIRIGIGINCGEAVAGSVGTSTRMEYTAIGDAVNIASRVCGIARPDQILVTEAVHEKVKHRFRTAMLGATQLKGRSRQVLVFEIIDDLRLPE